MPTAGAKPMATDIELLPLPEIHSRFHPMDWHAIEALATDYARANVEHHTAAKDAEIKALRAEREVICAEAVKYADKSGRLEAKVDRLADELRKITELRERHPDNLHDAIYIAGEALRDHEQEVGDG